MKSIDTIVIIVQALAISAILALLFAPAAIALQAEAAGPSYSQQYLQIGPERKTRSK